MKQSEKDRIDATEDKGATDAQPQGKYHRVYLHPTQFGRISGIHRVRSDVFLLYELHRLEPDQKV